MICGYDKNYEDLLKEFGFGTLSVRHEKALLKFAKQPHVCHAEGLKRHSTKGLVQ